MRIKDGVSLRGINPAMAICALVVDVAYLINDVEADLIGGTEKTTRDAKKGCLLQFSLVGLTPAQRNEVIASLKARLGDEFGVTRVANRIDVEWLPS